MVVPTPSLSPLCCGLFPSLGAPVPVHGLTALPRRNLDPCSRTRSLLCLQASVCRPSTVGQRACCKREEVSGVDDVLELKRMAHFPFHSHARPPSRAWTHPRPAAPFSLALSSNTAALSPRAVCPSENEKRVNSQDCLSTSWLSSEGHPIGF